MRVQCVIFCFSQPNIPHLKFGPFNCTRGEQTLLLWLSAMPIPFFTVFCFLNEKQEKFPNAGYMKCKFIITRVCAEVMCTDSDKAVKLCSGKQLI